MPTTYNFESVASSMDTLFQIISKKPINDWDNVYTKMQTAGRGQMRKKWISYTGNILSSIKLPFEYPFNTSAASAATGVLFTRALKEMNFNVMLKWPNDIVLIDKQEYKVGGILLEERNRIIVAGIGINVAVLPDMQAMDVKPVLKAGCLQQISANKLDPEKLWQELVNNIYKFYSQDFARIWINLANEYLLWRGKLIQLADGNQHQKGILEKLADDGRLVLMTDNGTKIFSSGEICLYH